VVESVLRALGDRFLPEEFLARSSFEVCNVFRLGEHRGGSVRQTSGITVEVSAASGEDFGKQIQDALLFLDQYRDELIRLGDVKELEDLRLDFGVTRKNGFLQSRYLPSELLMVAGSLNVGIEISIYGADEFG
jgi:hypothetical protein